MIRKFATALVRSVGERQAVFRASGEEPGRDGYSILTSGIELKNFRANPIVLFQHDPTEPIGRCVSIRAVGRDLVAVVEFAAAGASQIADKVCALVKQGVLSACSIGFDPHKIEPAKDGVRVIPSCSLLELSVVSIPALAGALVMERAAGGRGARALSYSARHRQVEVLSPALRSAAVAKLMPKPPMWN